MVGTVHLYYNLAVQYFRQNCIIIIISNIHMYYMIQTCY